MAKLSKANMYAIRWLNYEEKTPEDIASELKLNTKQVEEVLEKYGRADGNVPTNQQPVSRVRNMMSSSTKNNSHITVMTGEASLAIQNSKSHDNVSSKNQQSYIYRPNDR